MRRGGKNNLTMMRIRRHAQGPRVMTTGSDVQRFVQKKKQEQQDNRTAVMRSFQPETVVEFNFLCHSLTH